MARMKTILLGKITKISGYEGTVTVRTERNFAGKIPEAESVFLEIEGRPVPFLIEYIEQVSDGSLRLKFEDYDSYEKVKEFAGCNVLLSVSSLIPDSGHSSDDLSGFTIESAEGKNLGKISEIIENPGQLLLRVNDLHEKEFLIPFHEDLIVSVDPVQKKIIMIIPEGLIDLNS